MKKGQSIVEYVLIAILVILGVYFMGDYILRSVNAHFTLWDEGVQDSFDENLTQAPAGDVPPISSNCDCTAVNGMCGSPEVGSLCATNQREVDYSCNIQGCNGIHGDSVCISDPSCCSAPVDLGCGTFPLPYNSDGTVNTSPPTSPAPAPNNCYYYQRISEQQCGSVTSVTCTPDAACAPTCLGSIVAGTAAACTSTPPQLDKSIPISVVASEPLCSNPAQACQYYCEGGTFPNAEKTSCGGCGAVCPTSYAIDSFGDNGYWAGGGHGGGQCCGYNASCTNPPYAAACSCPLPDCGKNCSNVGPNQTFMCEYAMWVAPEAANHKFVGLLTTYTRTITIPAGYASGTVQIEFAADDGGNVAIDGTVVCNNSGVLSFQSPTTCIVPITPGNHLVTLTDTNAGSGPDWTSPWGTNSAGVSMQITSTDAAHSFPSFDTTQVDSWTSSVQCPDAQCWDCTQLCCVNASGTCQGD